MYLVFLTIITTMIAAVCTYYLHHSNETSSRMIIFAPDITKFSQDGGIYVTQEETFTRNMLPTTAMMTYQTQTPQQPNPITSTPFVTIVSPTADMMNLQPSTSQPYQPFPSELSDINMLPAIPMMTCLPSVSQQYHPLSIPFDYQPPFSFSPANPLLTPLPLSLPMNPQMVFFQNICPTPMPQTYSFQSTNDPAFPHIYQPFMTHPLSDRTPYSTSPVPQTYPLQYGSPQQNQSQPFHQPSQGMLPSETMTPQCSFDPNSCAWFFTCFHPRMEQIIQQMYSYMNKIQEPQQQPTTMSQFHYDTATSTNDLLNTGFSQPETFPSTRFTLASPRVSWAARLTQEETSSTTPESTQIQEIGKTSEASTGTTGKITESVSTQVVDTECQPDCKDLKLHCDKIEVQLNIYREDDKKGSSKKDSYDSDGSDEDESIDDESSDEDDCTCVSSKR